MSANGRERVNSKCESHADGYSMDLGETSDRSRDQRIIASDVRDILARRAASLLIGISYPLMRPPQLGRARLQV
jgi:hypothetical protein